MPDKNGITATVCMRLFDKYKIPLVIEIIVTGKLMNLLVNLAAANFVLNKTQCTVKGIERQALFCSMLSVMRLLSSRWQCAFNFSSLVRCY